MERPNLTEPGAETAGEFVAEDSDGTSGDCTDSTETARGGRPLRIAWIKVYGRFRVCRCTAVSVFRVHRWPVSESSHS